MEGSNKSQIVFDELVTINTEFKGIYLSLPEKCMHCSTKLSIWKGVENEHTYSCLNCNYVEGDCCEGITVNHYKYHYHPIYKILNSKILDVLNG